MDFQLNEQLARDCYVLGRNGSCQLLLHRNALYPWFILVPECVESEFYRLDTALQNKVMALINLVSRFIENHFTIDKLNIAAIGNIVAQLHIHVIGRRRDDPAWPGVVWGTTQSAAYTPERIAEIKSWLDAEYFYHAD